MLKAKNKKIRIILAAALALAMVLSGSVRADDGALTGDLEATNEQLQGQISDEQQRIDELKNSVSDIENYVQELDREMERISEIISSYEDQKAANLTAIEGLQNTIAQIEVKISAKEAEIRDKEAEVKDNYGKMQKRIQFLYENVNTNYLVAILSSSSFSEAFEKIQYLLELSSYNNRMMEKLKKSVNELNVLKNDLEAEKAEVEAKQAEIRKQNDEISLLESAQQSQQEMYSQIVEIKQSEMVDMQNEIDEAQAIIDTLSSEVAANEAQINSIVAEYEAQRAAAEAERLAAEEAALAAAREAARREAERLAAEEAARIAAEEEAARQAAEEAGEEYEASEQETPSWEEYYQEPEPEPSYSSSGFIWPLPGSWQTITSYFGYRGDDPDLAGFGEAVAFHTGIDIYAPSGTPIYSVADGVVVVSNYSYNIGWYMAIYHGNGIYTEMHHMCQEAVVSVGQPVSQGQTVGYVGATGLYCTGPHLHFGVCLGDAAWEAVTNYVDPLGYI